MSKDDAETARLKADLAAREMRKGRMEPSDVRKAASRRMRRAERK